MALTQTIPALPVRDVAAAAAAYVDRFGFTPDFQAADFAVLHRDAAVVHLWCADDAGWADRSDLASRPISSGAESFLAGTASCRIQVDGEPALESLFAEYAAAGILHHTSVGGIADTDFGARDFHTLDVDGNLVSFFTWV